MTKIFHHDQTNFHTFSAKICQISLSRSSKIMHYSGKIFEDLGGKCLILQDFARNIGILEDLGRKCLIVHDLERNV